MAKVATHSVVLKSVDVAPSLELAGVVLSLMDVLTFFLLLLRVDILALKTPIHTGESRRCHCLPTLLYCSPASQREAVQTADGSGTERLTSSLALSSQAFGSLALN